MKIQVYSILVFVYVGMFFRASHNHLFPSSSTILSFHSKDTRCRSFILPWSRFMCQFFPSLWHVFMRHVFFFLEKRKKEKIYFLFLVFILLIIKVSIHFFVLNLKIHLLLCFLSLCGTFTLMLFFFFLSIN